jgi:hypothetical protein
MVLYWNDIIHNLSYQGRSDKNEFWSLFNVEPFCEYIVKNFCEHELHILTEFKFYGPHITRSVCNCDCAKNHINMVHYSLRVARMDGDDSCHSGCECGCDFGCDCNSKNCNDGILTCLKKHKYQHAVDTFVKLSATMYEQPDKYATEYMSFANEGAPVAYPRIFALR